MSINGDTGQVPSFVDPTIRDRHCGQTQDPDEQRIANLMSEIIQHAFNKSPTDLESLKKKCNDLCKIVSAPDKKHLIKAAESIYNILTQIPMHKEQAKHSNLIILRIPGKEDLLFIKGSGGSPSSAVMNKIKIIQEETDLEIIAIKKFFSKLEIEKEAGVPSDSDLATQANLLARRQQLEQIQRNILNKNYTCEEKHTTTIIKEDPQIKKCFDACKSLLEKTMDHTLTYPRLCTIS